MGFLKVLTIVVFLLIFFFITGFKFEMEYNSIENNTIFNNFEEIIL